MFFPQRFDQCVGENEGERMNERKPWENRTMRPLSTTLRYIGHLNVQATTKWPPLDRGRCSDRAAEPTMHTHTGSLSGFCFELSQTHHSFRPVLSLILSLSHPPTHTFFLSFCHSVLQDPSGKRHCQRHHETTSDGFPTGHLTTTVWLGPRWRLISSSARTVFSTTALDQRDCVIRHSNSLYYFTWFSLFMLIIVLMIRI